MSVEEKKQICFAHYTVYILNHHNNCEASMQGDESSYKGNGGEENLNLDIEKVHIYKH